MSQDDVCTLVARSRHFEVRRTVSRKAYREGLYAIGRGRRMKLGEGAAGERRSPFARSTVLMASAGIKVTPQRSADRAEGAGHPRLQRTLRPLGRGLL